MLLKYLSRESDALKHNLEEKKVMREKKYACAKTKAKNSLAAVTSARLISAFVFDLRIVHSLYFLSSKPCWNNNLDLRKTYE